MGAPVVTPRTRFILLNQSILGASMYLDATDPDNDPITQYRFTDLLAGSTTGFIRYNGVPQGNGVTTTVSAANLNKVTFTAGSQIGTENVRIEVFANGQWSAPVNSLMYFVRDNVTPPVITITNPTILQDELISISSVMSAADPDGWPIDKFYIRDQLSGADSGELRLNGVTQAQGAFRYYTAAEVGNLKYYARSYTENERLEFFAWDGAKWSEYAFATPKVTRNANAPVAFYNDATVKAGRSNAISQLLGWNDADGSTIKWVEFYDSNSSAASGKLELNGTPVAAGQWHRVAIQDIATMRYLGALGQFDETIQYRVSDGRNVSASQNILLHSVELPRVKNQFVHQTALWNIQVKGLIERLDGGPAILTYEFLETNPSPTSGFLRLGNTNLVANQVHTVTGAQLNNNLLTFRTARPEVRTIDEIYVRAWNGTFWSSWSNIEVRSESLYRHAIKDLDNTLDLTSLESNNWLDYTPLVQPDPLTISYSFMNQWTTLYQPGDGATDDNDSAFTVAQRAMARRSFDLISDVSKLNFEEISDNQANSFGQEGGIIRMRNYANPDGMAAAFAYFPGAADQSGDIWMNVAFTSTTAGGTQSGSYTQSVFMHELGHAVGFKHPHDGQPILPAGVDNDNGTVMTYQSRGDVNPATYMMYDILSLQDYYGINTTTRTGDTLYDIPGYFNGDDNVFMVIWDAGGNDTLSIAGAQLDSVIDIRQGSFSSFGAQFNPFTQQFTLLTQHVGVAFGADIENAIGSSNNDQINGNYLNNTLRGGDGDDEIFSFAGDDLMMGETGNDTFHWGAGQGSDTIDENRLSGRDRIVLDNFPTLNSFTNDLSFRRLGRDLIVELALDNGDIETTLKITNQEWGSYRVETLVLNGTDIDLLSVYAGSTAASQRFTLSGGSSIFGQLATPA